MSNASLVRGDRRGSGRRFAALVTSMLAVSAAVAVMAPGASAQGGPPGGFVTICHVAGSLEDPANLVELTIAYDAAYGQAGHFLEPGTPNAGHEQDIEGPCPSGTTDTGPTGDTGTTDTGPTGDTADTGETGTTEAAAAPAAGGGGGELAFTGSSSLLIALGGAAMAGLGYALRRSLRSES